MPLSNMLSPYFTHPVANACFSNNIKIILLSIGVQAPLGTSPSNITLSPDAKLLLASAVKAGHPIGVRGEYSQAVLSLHGIDSKIMGCPSMLGVKEKESIIIDSRLLVGNCTLSGHHRELTAGWINYFVEHASGFVLQDEARIIRDIMDIDMGEIDLTAFKDSDYEVDLTNKLFDYGYYNNGSHEWGEVRDFFRKKGFFTLSLDRWKAYIESFAISAGLRFHGNIFALQNGVPAVFCPCDLRTLEMINLHRLPRVTNAEKFSILSDDKLKEMFDDFYAGLDEAKRPVYQYIQSSILSDYWVST
jgi:hypothetical protein